MPRKHFLKKSVVCFGTLFFIATLSSIIQSCCRHPEKVCLTIGKMSLVPYDDSGEKLAEYTKEIYGKALTLQLQVEKYGLEECAKNPLSVSLFPQAYALSCPVDVSGDDVMVFNISADRKFDEEHEAGSRLNDLFEIHNSEALYSNYVNNVVVSLLLVNNPADTGTFVFTVHMELASGRVFDARSVPVKLLK